MNKNLFLIFIFIALLSGGCATSGAIGGKNSDSLFDSAIASCQTKGCLDSVEVKTEKPSAITPDMVIINGEVPVAEEHTVGYFEYGMSDGKVFSTEPVVTSAGSISVVLVGLKPEKEYWYKFQAVGPSKEISEGTKVTFRTPKGKPCLTLATASAGLGSGLLSFGLANREPITGGIGLVLSLYAMLDKETSPACKTAAAIIGGAFGAGFGGHSQKTVKSSGGGGGGGGGGPSIPPNGGTGPTNPPNF